MKLRKKTLFMYFPLIRFIVYLYFIYEVYISIIYFAHKCEHLSFSFKAHCIDLTEILLTGLFSMRQALIDCKVNMREANLNQGNKKCFLNLPN